MIIEVDEILGEVEPCIPACNVCGVGWCGAKNMRVRQGDKKLVYCLTKGLELKIKEA